MSQDIPVTGYAILGLLTFGDELTGYEIKQRADFTPVSYTHLTLPTILRV